MKKSNLIFIILIVMFTMMGCSANENEQKQKNISSLSNIKVLNKHHSEDWEKYWVEAKDPNNPDKESFTIYMEKMVWNLIKKKETYVAEYDNETKEELKEGEFRLTQILYPEDSDKYLNHQH